MNKLVGLLGDGTFNKTRVTSKIGLYLKYMRDQYMVHLQNNPKHEFPPTILESEWKTLLDYVKDKTL